MRITLAVTEGPHQGQKFSFSAHDTFLVGRSRRAHFRLPEKDRYFSRIHFLIEVNPPYCRLMDMGSRNGTFVNGSKVEIADLKNADQIRAGRTLILVQVEENGQGIAQPIEVMPEEPVDVAVPPPRSTRSQPAGRCRVCECQINQPNGGTPQLICSDCTQQIRGQEQFIDGYQLVRPLGQGAMGIVYLALRKLDYRLVALKTIIPAVAGSSTQVERFLREVEILRKLSHPNIVSFRETGEANGRLFFAMDYIRGSGDANRLLKLHGRMPIGRAVRLTCQLLDALGYAHDLGFVHRDIKPSNMLIADEKGRETVKLADFGLARVYQSSQLSGLTVTGDFGGTVAFMAPEQITEYRDAKPAVDQYGAAASLYNMLTNQYVYDLPNDLTKQLYLVLHEECVPIRSRRTDIPQALANVIARALSREVSDRFPHVRDLHAALLPFSD